MSDSEHKVIQEAGACEQRSSVELGDKLVHLIERLFESCPLFTYKRDSLTKTSKTHKS